MPQVKISSFFQPTCSKTENPLPIRKVEASCLLYREVNVNSRKDLAFEDSDFTSKSDFDDDVPQLQRDCKYKLAGSLPSSSRNLSKKRVYEQYHLDLGQSDFILHACLVCGLMYARGVEEDEKLHRKFHQDYDRGMQIKGWRNERVIYGPLSNNDRILLVLDNDPPSQKRLVQKVVNLTKKELGFADDHIIHGLCKVYLFISAHRIVGWLVAEPIQTAHRVISCSSSSNSYHITNPEITTEEKMNGLDSKKSPETTLQFGDIKFHRELIKKECHATGSKLSKWDGGALICEEEAVPAKCGVRAIWVVSSCRRKRIASQLMDAVRKNFSTGQVLEISKCAFSSPTSAGMAFASSYTNSRSFLVYRENDV
ncbi:hypothetical protein KSP39_PZI008559 [Platanthera zijinensis]|uniref:N-acetyltransferase ESCO2 n=1 Tax=Platanthera zijinensis TaxID=2320716 RepID=A0AAP0BM12_9ASPA